MVVCACVPPQNPSSQLRDPCAFADDDGQHYLIAGTFNYYISALGPDMMSLAETPRLITVNNALGTFGPGKTDDKPFMHKYNGTYYLSWGCFYAMGASPYGPFDYAGVALDTSFIEPAFRMNSTSGPWYTHEDYKDRGERGEGGCTAGRRDGACALCSGRAGHRGLGGVRHRTVCCGGRLHC